MKQLKIANFFGKEAQHHKADEELDEINEAFEIYINDQNKENLKNLLMEVYDLSNVIEGLYTQIGGCMREVQAEKEYKLYRTIQIIKKIPKYKKNKLEAYEQLRREV